MSREREEAQLRAALAPLRSRDEALARPFTTMWSAAERRVAASKPTGRPYRWIAATSLAALIVAVAVSYRTARIESAPHSRSDAVPQRDKSDVERLHRVPLHVDPLSAWRSPTDFLLAASDHELLRSVPRFGLPAVDSITLPSQEI